MFKKIYALAIIAMAGLAFSLNAQQPVTKEYKLKDGEKVAMQKDFKAHRLDNNGCYRASKARGCEDCLNGITLTDDQKAKIQKLSDKESKSRGEQRRKAIEKHDKEMKKILTPAQYEQYKSNLKAKKEGKKNFRKEGNRKNACAANSCNQPCGKGACDTQCQTACSDNACNAACDSAQQCAPQRCKDGGKHGKKHHRHAACDKSCDKQ